MLRRRSSFWGRTPAPPISETLLDDALHVRGLVRFWHLFPPRALPATTRGGSDGRPEETAAPFADLMRGLSPASCFVVAQAWERHAAGGDAPAAEAEARASYTHFFALVGRAREQEVRSHFVTSVERFRDAAWQAFLRIEDGAARRTHKRRGDQRKHKY